MGNLATAAPLKPDTCPQTPESWPQPDWNEVAYDNDHAVIGRAAFEVLQDCTGFRPKPMWVGKMWRCRYRDKWWLAYVNVKLEIEWMEILIS